MLDVDLEVVLQVLPDPGHICDHVGAERLERRVLELGALAAESRQRPTATLSQRFTGAAERNSSPAAAADSTGQRLSDGPTITPARRASEEAENNDAN